MRIAAIVAIGLLLSAGGFFLSYRMFDEIAAASTGYNATAKGFFGWDFSFAEHDFVEDPGGGYKPVLIQSGTKIRYGHLAIEVGVAAILGFGIAASIVLSFSTQRNKLGEQVGDDQSPTRCEVDE